MDDEIASALTLAPTNGEGITAPHNAIEAHRPRDHFFSAGLPLVYSESGPCDYRAGEDMNGWDKLAEIERDPARASGAWVFRDSRVPVTALFENLRDGATVDQFLAWFPGVSRAQVAAVLDHEAGLFTAASA